MKGATELNFAHYAPLEMLFPMASFFGTLKIVAETMDYSPWFRSISLRTYNYNYARWFNMLFLLCYAIE